MLGGYVVAISKPFWNGLNGKGYFIFGFEPRWLYVFISIVQGGDGWVACYVLCVSTLNVPISINLRDIWLRSEECIVVESVINYFCS